MAVARSFREGWLTSLKLDSLRDDSAELFLFRLGLKADKNGVHHGEPELLRAAVYPLQVSRRRLADVTRYRDKCVSAGLLRLWTAADGRPYVQILNFRQRTPNEKARFPLPPGEPDDTGQEQLALAADFSPPGEVNRIKEKGGARARQPSHEISESDWVEQLQARWPQLDVRAELAKAMKRKPDLERVWFARHWLPNCSPKVTLRERTMPNENARDAIVYGVDPDGWRSWLARVFPDAAFAEWRDVPPDIRQRFASECLKAG